MSVSQRFGWRLSLGVLLLAWAGVVLTPPAEATWVYPSSHCRTLGDCVRDTDSGSVVLVAGLVDEDILVEKPITFAAFVAGPPSKLRATDLGHHEMTVRWQDNSLDESGFVVVYWRADLPSYPKETQVGAGSESKKVSGLEPNQYYRFSVCAVRSGQRECAREQLAQTTVPGASQLLVEKIWVRPGPPIQGDGMKILWTECNRGERSEGHWTSVMLDGTQMYLRSHPALAESECRIHSLERYVPLGSGGATLVIEIAVDYELDYAEADEADNRRKVGVRIGTGIAGDAGQGGSTTGEAGGGDELTTGLPSGDGGYLWDIPF